MRVRPILFALLTLTANNAIAAEISVDEARAIASEFINAGQKGSARAAASPATFTLAQQTEGYYAFNRGTDGGYVIVAANDNARQSVLGYADSGTFDAGNMPEAMAWWLSEYSRQMAYAATTGASTTVSEASATRNAIAPLLTTLWGQDEPYNALCPTYRGTVCPTGCAATAMAQIMNYHEWPATGSGINTYMWQVNNMDQALLSVDFSQSTYDWANMSDRYDSNSSEESKAAVAKLMYDVGVAFDMQYNPSGSSATSFTLTQRMPLHFGYAKSMQYISRDYYSLDEWTETIYGEIAAGRPVFYAGTSESGGHAFVVDGYSDGYFHLNWGWQGASNGYFLLEALDPVVQGTGGSESGFFFSQNAIVGLERPNADNDQYQALMYCDGDFRANATTTTRYANVEFTGGFYNFSLVARNFTVGLKAVSQSGTVTYIETMFTSDFKPLSGFTTIEVPMSNMPTANGTYTLYPAYRDNTTGEWHDMRIRQSSLARSVRAVVTGSIITLSSSTVQTPSLSITAIEPSASIYAGTEFGLSMTLSNTGDYFSDRIYVAMVQAGTNMVVANSNQKLLDIDNGETQTLDFNMTAPTTAGSYELVAVWNGTIISQRYAVNVTQAPSGQLQLTVDGPLTVTKAPTTDDQSISLTANITCTSGIYSGSIYAFVFHPMTNASITGYADDVTIAAGESAKLDFEGRFEQGEVGSTYQVILYYIANNSYTELAPFVSASTMFTYEAGTGIDQTLLNAAPRDIRVYSLAGALVLRQTASTPDLSALPAGVYMVNDGQQVRKVVKK